MKKRCCIVGAAPIGDYNKILSFVGDQDYFIYCDAGLKHSDFLGFPPDLIVGDFDSYDPNQLSAKFNNVLIETITLPQKKDDTDTVYAAKEGLKRGFNNFVLIGCTGDRLDHSVSNLSLLLFLEENLAHGLMVDEFHTVQIVSRKPAKVSCSFPYFSIFPAGSNAEGITVKNALFPLENANLKASFPLGISNEPLPGKTAEISVKKGKLFLFSVFDRQ